LRSIDNQPRQDVRRASDILNGGFRLEYSNKGFDVVGTLGILRLAAQRGLIDLADSFARLIRTNFRYRQDILDAMLAEWPWHSVTGLPLP
jgi:hypothetical protein